MLYGILSKYITLCCILIVYLFFRTLDAGLAEAVSSLIWAAPRLQTDIAELKIISDQLAVKYGKPYALAARENGLNSVNEKLVHKLSVQAPPKVLVEKYLIGKIFFPFLCCEVIFKFMLDMY